MGGEMKAVGYVRVSRVLGREGESFLSPQLQREEIERTARREGLDVVEVVEELDASGGSRDRPGWNRAIEMVERGEADGVVVWNLARFSRSVKDALGALERIEAAGGRLWSATEQLDDSASGRMVRTILLSVAENERDRARASFAASTASAVARGVHTASRVPIGYRRGPDKRLVPDPETAPVVLGAFERRAKGLSWVGLARWLGEQGHPRTESGAKSIVHNPCYLGQARYGDQVKENAHEAIVSKALFRKCQAPGRRSARSGLLTERYLLQGVATCASCSRVMYLSGGRRTKDYAHYVCRRIECDEHAYARAGELDEHVLDLAFEPLRRGGLEAQWVARPGGDADLDEAEAALDEARAEMSSFLADPKLRSVLGPDAYAEAAQAHVALTNQLESDLDEARRAATGGREVIGHLWNTEWGWAERRDWLERVVKSVVVARGRGPLSERAEVELR
jgi:DNA invertase Pin-like site-specific DNA recombinase